MSLENLASATTITVEDVEKQIKPHLKLPIEERHSEFYVLKSDTREYYQGDLIAIPQSLRNSIESEFGFLISNTCDMQEGREDRILIIPLKILAKPSRKNLRDGDYDHYMALFDNVTKYKNTKFFYFPPIPQVGPLSGTAGLYGAFNKVVSVSSKMLNDAINNDSNVRICSLHSTGYYILLIKLAVHLFRPDERFSNLSA